MFKKIFSKLSLPISLVVFMALSSQATIPIGPIPITGQTLAVGLIASLASLPVGLLTIAFYILFGAIGIPVFANAHAGLGVIFGLSGGYIWGFFIYLLITKVIMDRSKNSIPLVVLANSSAAVIQLFIGAFWMMFYAHMTLPAAIQLGVLPFLVPGALKIVFITGLTALCWHYYPKLKAII
ncbi:biotin transporter BioY [Oenococcus alcoholitolerans]|uniref:biotin transporter BioY n=1 Tax=Oenococcus alcoholitolerans TaxID=931074 RepID=UPI003F708DA1